MTKEKLQVIFRMVYNPYTKRYECEAFLPEDPVRYGRIGNYAHIGQHSEASLEYYWKSKKASPEQYAELYKELQRIYDDVILVIKQRLNYDILRKNWQ